MNDLRNEPFALIGVNVVDHDPASLKQVMTKEQVTWRTFADKGEIRRTWNEPATPTFYVLDHEGRIRHVWVGSPGRKAFDRALEDLIRRAKTASESEDNQPD